MTTIRGVSITALALAAGALPAPAQTAPVRGVSLWPGTEIRATMASPAAGARQVRGRLVVLAGDTLRVTPRGTNTIATYQVASVERLEVRGRRQRTLGFALGAAVGAGITAAIAGPDWNRGGISRDQFAGLVATNALIGGWVGLAFGPREWTVLPLRR